MFLRQVMRRNRSLIDVAVKLHQTGQIQPDTYVIDLDQTLRNAQMILEKAKKQNIELYFMLKQLGRNPLIAQGLMKLGYKGAVVVDYREALVMMEAGVPLGNVGHLVQTPKALLEQVISYGTEVMTVFSIEKLREINHAAGNVGKVQDVILKVYSEGDLQYPSQEGGVDINELAMFIEESKALSNVKIVGATSFPAFLYNPKDNAIEKVNNYDTIMEAIKVMKEHGCTIKQINAPSTTSVATLDLMQSTSVTHGEPGHGLTGTTPAHAYRDMEEIPSIVYLTEVSHNFKGNSYGYGGGYYRRSHVAEALNVTLEDETIVDVIPIEPDNIDYYFKLNKELPISSTLIMSFRFQIFVTRSQVALVKGIGTDNISILGIYNSLGKKE